MGIFYSTRNSKEGSPRTWLVNDGGREKQQQADRLRGIHKQGSVLKESKVVGAAVVLELACRTRHEKNSFVSWPYCGYWWVCMDQSLCQSFSHRTTMNATTPLAIMDASTPMCRRCHCSSPEVRLSCGCTLHSVRAVRIGFEKRSKKLWIWPCMIGCFYVWILLGSECQTFVVWKQEKRK